MLSRSLFCLQCSWSHLGPDQFIYTAFCLISRVGYCRTSGSRKKNIAHALFTATSLTQPGGLSPRRAGRFCTLSMPSCPLYTVLVCLSSARSANWLLTNHANRLRIAQPDLSHPLPINISVTTSASSVTGTSAWNAEVRPSKRWNTSKPRMDTTSFA